MKLMNWIACLTPLFLSAAQESTPAPPDTGVLLHVEGAEPGYTLLAPLRSTETVLIDEKGAVVNRWTSEFTPGNAADLLPNGDLLRAGKIGTNTRFHGGGEGGVLEQFTWEGELVWSYDLSAEDHLHHHDFEVLPNGNVLVVVWEGKSKDDALAAGRRPNSVGETGLWPDALWELKPIEPNGAEIVWAWRAWDHLVQDSDANLAHYGDPATHPQRIDINIGAPQLEQPETENARRAREEELQRLRALGYIDDAEEEGEGREDGREREAADWMHTNSIDYHADLDLIVISVRNFSEVFVIDHSTTTEQAAGTEGGRYGRGGDLLWRWGNATNTRQAQPQTLFGQHDARWTRDDERVALSVFNNGSGRPDGDFSSVDLVHVPIDSGDWVADQNGFPALPEQAAWSYSAPERFDFFSSHISGAEPLSEGRFLVCEGDDGRVFQVNRAGDMLWEFVSPFQGDPERGASPRGPRGPGRGNRGPNGGAPPRRTTDGGPQPGPDRRGGHGSATALFRAVHIPLDHPGVSEHAKPASTK